MQTIDFESFPSRRRLVGTWYLTGLVTGQAVPNAAL